MFPENDHFSRFTREMVRMAEIYDKTNIVKASMRNAKTRVHQCNLNSSLPAKQYSRITTVSLINEIYGCNKEIRYLFVVAILRSCLLMLVVPGKAFTLPSVHSRKCLFGTSSLLCSDLERIESKFCLSDILCGT